MAEILRPLGLSVAYDAQRALIKILLASEGLTRAFDLKNGITPKRTALVHANSCMNSGIPVHIIDMHDRIMSCSC